MKKVFLNVGMRVYHVYVQNVNIFKDIKRYVNISWYVRLAFVPGRI